MTRNGQLLGETYYPSCVVNLRIRFDEAMTLNPQVFPSSSVNANLNQPIPPQTLIGGNRLVSYSSGADASQVAGRIPKSASIELPAYRQAGTFRLTFDFNDLPIDPRTVRSMAVSIYIDTVTGYSFANAMGRTQTVSGPGSGAVMARTRQLSMLTPTDENCVMVGLADTWHVRHTATGSEVSIEGRDLRCVFLDSPITPELLVDVPLGEPIDEVIRFVVSKHPYGDQMQVVCSADSEWPNGSIPSPGTVDGVTAITPRTKRGANGRFLRKSDIGGDPNALNFWDIITRYCSLVGAVPYFTTNQLTIKPARSLYDQQSAITKNPSIPTPFRDGRVREVGDELINYRRLVFGRNVEELSVERKMGGRTPSIVEVVSLDTSAKERGEQKLLVARWPNAAAAKPLSGPQPLVQNAAPAQVSGVAPSGAFGKEDVTRISVPGVTSQERLQQIAQDLFEEISRGEMGGSVRTKSLASFGDGNEDPDLLRMRPGDAVELLVDATRLRAYAPVVSPLNEQERTDAGALTAKLTQQFGGDSNLARVIVATMRGGVLELQNTFRVSNVKFDWSIGDGVSVAFDFHNYVIARNQVTPIAPAAPAAAPVLGAPAAKGG